MFSARSDLIFLSCLPNQGGGELLSESETDGRPRADKQARIATYHPGTPHAVFTVCGKYMVVVMSSC